AEDALRELPRLALVLGSDAIRRSLTCLVARGEKRPHCLAVIVSARVVVREERGVLEAALRRLCLEERADALVQLPPLLQQQPLVGHLLREALAEAELVARERGLAVHESAALELGQLALHVDAVVGEQRGKLTSPELASEDGGHLHDALGARAETVEARRDHLLHGAGNREVGQRARQRDIASRGRDEVALLEQPAHDLL